MFNIMLLAIAVFVFVFFAAKLIPNPRREMLKSKQAEYEHGRWQDEYIHSSKK